MEKRENMKPKKTLEQDNTKPEDDQKEEDEMDIMSQYMLQPVEGLCRTIGDRVWMVEYNDISVIVEWSVLLIEEILFLSENTVKDCITTPTFTASLLSMQYL